MRATRTHRHHLRSLTIAALLALCSAACRQQPPAPLDDQAAGRLLAALDDACNARDFAAYADHFEPGNQPLCDVHLAYMRQLLVPERSFQRRSKLSDFVVREGRGIALTHVDYGLAEHATDWDGYLVLRPGDGFLPKVQFAVPVDPQLLGMVDGPRFHCDACNYRIGAPGPWLVVPIPRQQTGCMEDVAFYDLHSDLQVMNSVWIGDRDGAAAEGLRELLACREVNARIEPWSPPALTGPGLTTARASFTQDGRTTALHLVVHGRVHYLLTVEGAAAALERNAARVEQLLASFHLLDDRSPAATQQRAAEAHLGARVEADNRFHHRATGVSFSGPPGWRADLVHGPHLFKVGFHCPEQRGTIWATALTIAAHRHDQRLRDADLIVDRSLERRELTVAADDGWHSLVDAARPARCRQLTCTDAGPGRSHELQAILTDDFLLVFEWHADTAVTDAIAATLRSLAW